jgi:hypothetical protein
MNTALRQALLVSAGLLVVLMTGFATTTTASAAFTLTTELCKDGKVAICWEEKEKGTTLKELKGEEDFEENSTKAAVFESTFNKGAVPVKIECASAKTKGGKVVQNEPLVKATTITIAAIEFENCKLVTPKNCTVQTPIITKSLEGEAVNQAVVGEGFLFKRSTSIIVEIKYTGEECLLKGNQPVTGSQICLWKTPTEDLKEQLLTCEKSESKLFFDVTKEPASLELQAGIKFPSLTDDWDIELG